MTGVKVLKRAIETCHPTEGLIIELYISLVRDQSVSMFESLQTVSSFSLHC